MSLCYFNNNNKIIIITIIIITSIYWSFQCAQHCAQCYISFHPHVSPRSKNYYCLYFSHEASASLIPRGDTARKRQDQEANWVCLFLKNPKYYLLLHFHTYSNFKSIQSYSYPLYYWVLSTAFSIFSAMTPHAIFKKSSTTQITPSPSACAPEPG